MKALLIFLVVLAGLTTGAPTARQVRTTRDTRDPGGEPGHNRPPVNVFVINIDDLRPSLGAYGIAEAKTPNIDKLARKGTTFMNAFVQQTVCSPSRSSYMTSRRPEGVKGVNGTGVFNFINHIRQTAFGKTWVTFPQYFKSFGYWANGGGKSFHDELPPSYDGNLSWSLDIPYLPTSKEQCNQSSPETLLWSTGPPNLVNPKAVCPYNRPDNLFFEYKLVDKLIEGLNYSLSANMPFFLWGGFFKPHSPYIMPKRIWDNFDFGGISLPTHKILDVPLDFSDAALFNYVQDIESLPPWRNSTTILDYDADLAFPDEWIKIVRRGYYAAMSWTDEQVGRFIQVLKDRGLYDNTLFVLFSDNGMRIGEGSAYMKCDLWDISSRVPLIFAGPGIPKGRVRYTPVEILDVFPTMASLAGLPIPDFAQGKDLSTLIRHENHCDVKKGVAFSQHPRCNDYTEPRPWRKITIQTQWACMGTTKNQFKYMGYSVRTIAWRYTEWRVWNVSLSRADWSPAGLLGAELYDHSFTTGFGPSMFNDNEIHNLYNSNKESKAVYDLSNLLHAQFDANFVAPAPWVAPVDFDSDGDADDFFGEGGEDDDCDE